MAKRTQTAATSAGPAIKPAGLMVDGPPIIISAAGGQAGRTGRMLVLVPPDDAKATEAVLRTTAGIRMQTLGQTGGVTPDPDSALLLPHLGVAVVNADADRHEALSVAAAGGAAGFAGAPEPEFVLYAAGMEAAWLRGYRDAVDHIAGRMLDGAPAAGDPPREAAISGTPAATWGVLATRAAAGKLSGRGVRIAVLDTGLDLTHPDFAARPPAGQASFVPGEAVQDGNGHGTHCAGVATVGGAPRATTTRYGVAGEASLFVGKVLSDLGQGEEGWILAGIEWALSQQCRIVSMSLSGQAPPSRIFEQVARRALARNCLLIAAAGNDSNRPQRLMPVGYPANCESILAVAALDRQLAVARFSNMGGQAGDRIDIAGPGVGVTSAWPGMRRYRQESGTSMATPFVAGVAALLAEANPGLSAQGLAKALLGSARDLPGRRAEDVGAGLVQAPG